MVKQLLIKLLKLTLNSKIIVVGVKKEYGYHPLDTDSEKIEQFSIVVALCIHQIQVYDATC